MLPDKQDKWMKRFFGALALGYISLLILAAWRPEARPGFLSPSSLWAQVFLIKVFGFPAGIPVFATTHEKDLQDGLKVVALDQLHGMACLLPVAIEEKRGATDLLYTYDRGCPTQSFSLRWRENLLETAFHNALMSILMRRSAGLKQHAEMPSTLGPDAPKRIKKSFGSAFCRKSFEKGFAADRVALIWVMTRGSYSRPGRVPYFSYGFDWDCRSDVEHGQEVWGGRSLDSAGLNDHGLNERWPFLRQKL